MIIRDTNIQINNKNLIESSAMTMISLHDKELFDICIWNIDRYPTYVYVE